MGNLLREKLSDAVLEGIDAVHDMDVTHDAYAWSAADAIIAALPDMVKPLEWNDDPGFSFSGPAFKAVTPFGYYRIVDTLVGRSMKFRIYAPNFNKPIATRSSLEAAKAAANAHHVAQVLSAFGIEGDG